ncbi:DUF1697 domain-containing protein [Pseudorhodoferax sp.]|uniref:DUF1697 domain-containing protein n=1 Tax=Pseudorhodoferax sp. TaxID=1993553 RepID=UPI002DD683BA|nr:DUF1697 domain-containing protein [Pseudorhodoferax sp.]
MPTVVAFLRAINVGGRFIRMAELARHFEALGLEAVSTYINSGNVLFTSRARNLARLETVMEEGLAPLLGFRSEVFLRRPDEVHAVAATAAAHRRRVAASGEVNVAFLARPLAAEQVSALQGLRTDLDDFAHDGREIYWLCKGSQTQSTFSNAVLERRLRLRCTFRRVNMLEKLSAQLKATA